VIHAGQQDRLFGAWGSWDFKQCSNGKCGVVWLDPMPLTRDIGKAYKDYYTHLPGDKTSSPGLMRKMHEFMRLGYLDWKYNYQAGRWSHLKKIVARGVFLLPFRRGAMDERVRFLSAIPGGRLLDVGCGSGEWLVFMRNLGWDGDGVDWDQAAVEMARGKGLKVGCGAVEDQAYPEGCFDAITLNHVIEHVPDPEATLAECARVLKPSGTLVILTPNIDSFGYRVFRENWRGLEPPRHLHLMSPDSIRVLLARVGFPKTQVSTRNSSYMLHQSLMLWAGTAADHGRIRSGVIGGCGAGLMTVLEAILLRLNAGIGECIVTISERGGTIKS